MPKREGLRNFNYVLISNQGPNRARLNDYPDGKVNACNRSRAIVLMAGENPLNRSALTTKVEDIV